MTARRWSDLRRRAVQSARGGRAVVALIGGGLLSGCLASPLGQGQANLGEAVMRRALLAEGNVIVTPPQGFCIQRDSLTSNRSGSFAMIASCAQLTGFLGGYSVPPVVMTVTAVAHDAPGAAHDGSGIAEALVGQQILQQSQEDGLTVVHVRSPESLSPESDALHWRGMMALNGYTVGLALYGAKGSAATGEQGRNLLVWLAQQLRSDSPQRPQLTEASASSAISTPAEGQITRPKARPDRP